MRTMKERESWFEEQQKENKAFIADADICIRILEDLRADCQNAVVLSHSNRSKIKRTRLTIKDLLMKYEH